MSFLSETSVDFHEFTSSPIGLPISHIWRGYGSAIFLEFGSLHEGRRKRDGSLGNAKGEFTLMIQWSWRIEGKRRIWCGSWSDEPRWDRVFACFHGNTVASVELLGRLCEIDVKLSNGLHIVSLMTAQGDPEWGFM